MVGPLLAEQFRRRGIPLIPVTHGAASFVDELDGSRAGTRVMISAASPDLLRRPGKHDLGQISVHGRFHSWLSDHSPADVPVLPLAMAVEWFTRAVRTHDVGSRPPLVLRDLRVLRKVTFPDLAGAGHRIRVRGEWTGRDAIGELVLELAADDGTPHYQARLGRDTPPAGAAAEWHITNASPPPGRLALYGARALFHGPRFQAVRQVSGLSADGADGVVVGLNDLGWGGDDWYLDVGALDGGMQLVGVWALHVLGSVFPVGAEECRVHRPGLLTSQARSVVRAREVHRTGAYCDVAVLDDDGAPRVELLGVEVVLNPDWIGR
jgi:hypothetical protein